MNLKLIPNTCISKSEGEKKLFYKLQSGECLNGSVALHSLNLASHVSNAEGEADFVLLIPGKGILVIEVKDHERVKFEDGKWILGNDKPKVGGPVKQAREAMYSLLEYMMIDSEEIQNRMSELMAPIDQQLFICNDRQDELMLACAMLQRVREIFDTQLGIEGRKKMFMDLV